MQDRPMGIAPDMGQVTASAETALRSFLEGQADGLLSAIRLYVLRGGLARGADVSDVAAELLCETAIEALEHSDRFDPERRPMAWLLGIAANLVKRRRAQDALHHRREPLLADLAGADDPDADPLDALFRSPLPGPEESVLADAGARALLALVPEEDARVLRLAVIHELSGEEVARELGITPGAARVRIHRARTRLRQAWLKTHAAEEGSAR